MSSRDTGTAYMEMAANDNENQSRPTNSNGNKTNRFKDLIMENIKVIVGVAIVVVVAIIAIGLAIGLSGGGTPEPPEPPRTGLDFYPYGNISYNPTLPATYQKYVTLLNKFIKPYENGGAGGRRVLCEEEKPRPEGKVCAFEANWLQDCSKEKDWGFKSSSPCVLMTFHNDSTFNPVVYDSTDNLPDDLPGELKDSILRSTEENEQMVPQLVWVYCNKGHSYAHVQGFPIYYFPNMEDDDYLPPVVAVSFDLTYTDKLEVECSIWSKKLGATIKPHKFTIVKEG